MRKTISHRSKAALDRLRELCLALPEAHEVEAWGEPTFRVRNKIFAMFASAGTHHGAGRPAVWCLAGPGNQELSRYFVPPYVGPSGWIGIYLDRRVSWRGVAELLQDAHQLRAAKTKPRRAVGRRTPRAGRSNRPAR